MNASTNTIVISENTERPISKEDIKTLGECLTYQGFIKDAYRETGVSPNTINTYHETGKGMHGKVNKLMAFARAFLAGHTTTKPAA